MRPRNCSRRCSATLAYLPFRSPAQVARKVALGRLGHRLAVGARARELRLCWRWRWRMLFERMLRGQFLNWAELPAHAAAAYATELPAPADRPSAHKHDPLPAHAELLWPERSAIAPCPQCSAGPIASSIGSSTERGTLDPPDRGCGHCARQILANACARSSTRSFGSSSPIDNLTRVTGTADCDSRPRQSRTPATGRTSDS